jgi:lipoprotein-anchoring transpeptidase ErfK/SrfK
MPLLPHRSPLARATVRTLASFVIGAALLLPVAQPAFAQTDAIIPVINPLLLTGAAAAESTAPGAVEGALPALPLLNPSVGPLIKRTYPEIIDRRTTAFLPTLSPQLLDDLTPIEMPETSAHWVRVDLSEQMAVAYSGQTPVRGFVIASGLPKTPTVTGTFHVRAKVRAQLMEGGSVAAGNDYYLPNVQWVQYFYQDYAFHGTYWHNAFGAPRSHGCINMTNADAEWLWNFLGPAWDGNTVWQSVPKGEGALVIVHE